MGDKVGSRGAAKKRWQLRPACSHPARAFIFSVPSNAHFKTSHRMRRKGTFSHTDVLVRRLPHACPRRPSHLFHRVPVADNVAARYIGNVIVHGCQASHAQPALPSLRRVGVLNTHSSLKTATPLGDPSTPNLHKSAWPQPRHSESIPYSRKQNHKPKRRKLLEVFSASLQAHNHMCHGPALAEAHDTCWR